VADIATLTASEVVVRMGEIAVSRAPGDVLVSVGLGSCIGLALVCRRVRACGLAHVMLPVSTGREGRDDPVGAARPGKYADQAVPALLAGVGLLGARPATLDAILVGGAQMFKGSVGMDIGARNETAVRAALAGAGVRVIAAATAGGLGRTIRVHVADGTVTVREAGAHEVTLR
jgi:chemotaxis protein CheD